MERICVFCGSSPGSTPEYGIMAQRLGNALARRNLGLVYGGGSVGLMGMLAQSVIDNKGRVTGVITEELYEREVAHTGLSDLRVVGTMHERKALMAELSDGFIAMPGGFGTMDEIFEILTWAQLGIHSKPCGFLNTGGYYDQLIRFIDYMISSEFIHPSCKSLVKTDHDPKRLLDQFSNHLPIKADKAVWAKKLAANA